MVRRSSHVKIVDPGESARTTGEGRNRVVRPASFLTKRGLHTHLPHRVLGYARSELPCENPLLTRLVLFLDRHPFLYAQTPWSNVVRPLLWSENDVALAVMKYATGGKHLEECVSLGGAMR